MKNIGKLSLSDLNGSSSLNSDILSLSFGGVSNIHLENCISIVFTHLVVSLIYLYKDQHIN